MASYRDKSNTLSQSPNQSNYCEYINQMGAGCTCLKATSSCQRASAAHTALQIHKRIPSHEGGGL